MTRIAAFASAVLVLVLSSVRPGLAQAPLNDDVSRAVMILSLPFSEAIDTAAATTASSDPFCVGQGPTVWYAFTPASNMHLEANTFGSNYDTTLSAYAMDANGLRALACNDDTFGLQSRIRLAVEAGRTYLLMVGAYASGPGGNLTISVDVTAPPPPPLTLDLTVDGGTVQAVAGAVTVTGTVTCSRPTWVSVNGELTQKTGRDDIGAFFGVYVECDGVTSWSATANAAHRRSRGRALATFLPGQVVASVYSWGWDQANETYAHDAMSGVLHFRGSR